MLDAEVHLFGVAGYMDVLYATYVLLPSEIEIEPIAATRR